MWGELNPRQIVGTVKVAPPICYTDVVRTGFEPVRQIYISLTDRTLKRASTIPPPDCFIFSSNRKCT